MAMRDVMKAYEALTDGLRRFLTVEELVQKATEAFPDLLPGKAEMAEEAQRPLKEKLGLEKQQGQFLSRILVDPRGGTHLCHAMLLPRPGAQEALERLDQAGTLDLGAVRLERHGKAVHLISSNPPYLNAEDQTTIGAMQLGVDVAILDPKTDIAVLRGDVAQHSKYAGRRIFGSGINLTHLYKGRLPYLWYLERELGFVNKYYRGVASPDAVPDDVEGVATEKPWIAAIEGFAIGGHCQIVLTMDYVLAASDSFMTLPARKEGIIPGAANLRLPRFVGDRLARQLIQAERRIVCDSPEGRMICDEIVPPEAMDEAIERTVAMLASAGAVGAIANRRALRVGQEPLDLFRRYAAVYAREQADCHFSPALVRNLEENWGAARR